MYRFALLLTIVACGRPAEDSTPAGGTPSGTTPTSSLPTATTTTPPGPLQELADEGWTIQEGQLSYSSMDGCCLPLANCLGNNPSTPYGTYALPPAPGQTEEDFDIYFGWGSEVEAGLSRDFHLRADEAIVWMGPAPPTSKYLGMVTYLSTRDDEYGLAQWVGGAMGAPLNHPIFQAGFGSQPFWGQPIAVVTTADVGIEARVRDALVAEGWADEHIFYDRMAGDVARFGLDAGADTFQTAIRVAIPEDPAALDAYRADPQATLLRLTPPEGAYLSSPQPRAQLNPRGSGTDEEAWADALTELEDAIVASWPTHETNRQLTSPYWYETYDCIDGLVCTGEMRDRWTAVVNVLLPDDETFAVMFGTNHERTGKATYSSFSLHTLERQIGITSVNSAAMVGSARAFLPNHPQVDDLYAWVVARDCSAFAGMSCIEVPTDCPGAPLDRVFKITARAYLEPSTGAAPLSGEMKIDRLIGFRPAQNP